MEILLKIYDDADDWLSMLWLAAGPVLWALLTMLLASLLLAGSLWTPGPAWPVASAAILIGGLTPVAKHTVS